MSQKNRINEQITQLVSTSFRTLVNPQVNHTLQGDIGELIHLVDAETHPGIARDCLHAGLWLLADDLGRAHAICQELTSPLAAAWHAVVHRREGDFWNSKYWWRHAGSLDWTGLMEKIRAAISNPPAGLKTFVNAPSYEPSRFVDLVEAHASDDATAMIDALVAVQRLEWLALFEECLAAV